jgi:MFS family permease
MSEVKKNAPANPLREIVQPFIDLVHAPRALWGINLAYVIEGMVYFGMLGYLAIHFSDFVFSGLPGELRDEYSHDMVAVLTAGITISMFFLGTVADKKGVRFALLGAFVLMLCGRVLISGAPTVFGLRPEGLWSPLHLVTMAGILLVVVGYGMYQPAAYAAVKQFTTPKTAGMGFAMLYALMNLGGWFPTYAFLLRDERYLNFGIPGTFWVYTAFTLVALLSTWILLSRKTVADATAAASAERARIEAEEKAGKPEGPKQSEARVSGEGGLRRRVPFHMWVFALLILVAVAWKVPAPWGYGVAGAVLLGWVIAAVASRSAAWLARHPLGDAKFFFFIFALIPVQTLFAYNWLILPQYISRAFTGWIGEYFEIASNANPILIFILVPIIAAATQKAKVYRMMILGTFVMAAPAFLLALGPHPWTLFPYILIMTVGEAMWQPRFLQYAAEIAPPGRTGEYMGVAQLPWFLTKVMVPLLYSGWMMGRYCPAEGPKNTEFMWLIFGCIAISSSVFLFLARNWVGKDFKTKA